jgi:hypothetical protein
MLVISFIISASMFSVFVINVLLYTMVPAYRDTLLMKVSGKVNDIPVIEVTQDDLPDVVEFSELEPVKTAEIEDTIIPLNAIQEDTIEAPSTDSKKPEIIERTYYEDCGTGQGYWVIKYSDGSYGVE